MTLVIITALLPIFFTLFLGYFAGMRKMLDNQNVSLLNIFVMDFALPAAMFSSAVQVPRNVILGEVPLVVALTLGMWIVFAVIYVATRKLAKRSMQESSVIALTVGLPNYAALGIPVLEGVLGPGPQTSLHVAMSIACGSVLMTPIALMLLEAGKQEQSGTSLLKSLPKLMLASLKKPLVFCPIIGVILTLCGVKLPSFVFVALKPVAIASAGAALFLTGLILSARKLRITPSVLYNVLVVNILQGLLGVGIVYMMGISGDIAKATVMLLSLAAGFFGIVFGNRFGVKSQVAEGTLLLSSLLSILTIPLFIYIVDSLF